jgi:hypothetical protein
MMKIMMMRNTKMNSISGIHIFYYILDLVV